MEKQHLVLAEALLNAHKALAEDLRTLEDTLQPAAKTSLPELRARLTATQTHILDHFRFEEQNGYMDAVRKQQPRLERTIETLEEEHRQLGGTLDQLREKVFATTSLNDPLRHEIRDWIHQVRQHETRENLLVQDAFNLDLSAED